MVVVRRAVPADRHRIRAVHDAAIRGLAPAAYDDRQVGAWADSTTPGDDYPVEQGGNHVVVAERTDTDAVVGYGHLRPTDREIRAVYVHPAAAGAGVGTALLAALESRARDLRLDALSLTASLNAVGFYEQAGYERVGRETYATIHDDQTVELTVVRMRTSL